MNRIRTSTACCWASSPVLSGRWVCTRRRAADGQATRAHALILDVAADCRTYAPTASSG